jgi:hypothetical protein
VSLLNIKLPDFYNSYTVTVEAYLEEETIGRHDIILGVRFIQQLGLIFDFKRNTVIWDEITIPMRQMGSIKANELTSIDKPDSEAPTLVQKAVKRLEQDITFNKDNDHDYKTMILKCTIYLLPNKMNC